MSDKINSSSPSSPERAKQFLVVVATSVVVFVNYLAGVGYVNNKTPQEISDKYRTLITPAGYAFSIWGLIYSGLIIFSLYQALSSQTENLRFQKIRLLYILSCVANCVWIFLWHHEQIWASVAVIFILLASLALINANLQNEKNPAETWIARVPFNLYFGWVTVAAILNFTVALVSSGVKASDLTATISACVLVVAATILGIVIRLKLSIAAYALAIAWALTAIAVKHGGETVLVTLTAFGVIALLVAAIFPLSQIKKLA